MSIGGRFKNAINTGVGKTKDSDENLVNDGFTTVYTTPLTNSLGQNTPDDFASYVIECDVANVTNTGVQVSVRVKKQSGSTAYIVKSAPVPVGSSIQIIAGQKLVLERGDSLEALCETSGETVDVVVSLVENVNA